MRERRLNLNEPTYLIIPHLLGLFITSFKKLEPELHLTAESRFISRKHLEPVDDKYNGDESYTHPMIAMRESAEKQQEMEDTERLRETLQAREERKEEERLVNDQKGFLSAIDKLETERRARDN